jgi:hypothetical protein
MFSAIAIWTASAPFFLVDQPALSQALAPLIHIATAIAGLMSISCSYLAFLPPNAYRRWVEQRATAETAAGSSS